MLGRPVLGQTTSTAPPASDRTSKHKLTRDLKRGSFWVLAGYGGGQALRLGSNLVLWRLLYPEAFGLMALVNTFLQGLHMFSDVGIGPSIVQSPRGDEPEYLNTAWTIQVARSLVLFTIACVAARAVAHFYDAPPLATLIPLVALVTIISGFNSTRLVTAKRHVALGRATAIDLISQASGIAIVIPWAYVTRDVMAFAVGAVASAIVKLALSHTFLPGVQNRFTWDRPSAHALLRFGRWVFLSTLLTFAVLQSDRLIFGKLVSLQTLGVYSIATVWATIPVTVVSQVASSVIFPLLSRVHNARGDFAGALKQTRTTWLVLAGWMVACLGATGPTLIRFLYDQRAKDAGWILQFLSVGTWFASLEMPNRMALLARGRPLWMSVDSSAKLVAMVALIPTGYLQFGFPGAVAGFAGAELFSYLASLVGLARAGVSGLLVNASLSALVLATTVAGDFLRWPVRQLVQRVGLPYRATAFVEGMLLVLAISSVWAAAYFGYRRFSRTPTSSPTTASFPPSVSP